MKDFLSKAAKWLLSSFDNHTKGVSARKITAFVITASVVAIHAAYIRHLFVNKDFALMGEVLLIDYAFIAALLGMTTYQSIKQKNKDEQ